RCGAQSGPGGLSAGYRGRHPVFQGVSPGVAHALYVRASALAGARSGAARRQFDDQAFGGAAPDRLCARADRAIARPGGCRSDYCHAPAAPGPNRTCAAGTEPAIPVVRAVAAGKLPGSYRARTRAHPLSRHARPIADQRRSLRRPDEAVEGPLAAYRAASAAGYGAGGGGADYPCAAVRRVEPRFVARHQPVAAPAPGATRPAGVDTWAAWAGNVFRCIRRRVRAFARWHYGRAG